MGWPSRADREIRRALLDPCRGPSGVSEPSPRTALTKTDVVQRLRAVYEEPCSQYPNEEIKASCLALYETEKAQGTEMPAIISALQEHIELEEDRLRREREEARLRHRAEERLRAQQRFMAGADCGWTKLDGLNGLFCRRNGRTFRTVQDKDKRWALFRVTGPEEKGLILGTYQGRGDANKALEKIAYCPEPQVVI